MQREKAHFHKCTELLIYCFHSKGRQRIGCHTEKIYYTTKINPFPTYLASIIPAQMSSTEDEWPCRNPSYHVPEHYTYLGQRTDTNTLQIKIMKSKVSALTIWQYKWIQSTKRNPTTRHKAKEVDTRKDRKKEQQGWPHLANNFTLIKA